MNAALSVLQRWRQRLPKDGKLAALAFAWFFCILSGYYIIRPIRETMGVASGRESLNWLFTATFIVMLLAVPVYAACVSRLPRSRLVSLIYRFFSVTLLAFALLLQTDTPEWRLWVARAFFVWASVFSLYATSVFWSVLADLFDSADAKRLFGFVAAGGTLGAIAGSLLASQLASILPTHALLVFPAILLEIGLWFAGALQRRVLQCDAEGGQPSRDGVGVANAPAAQSVTTAQAVTSADATDATQGAPTGGGLMDGVVSIVRSRYLLVICVSLFLGQLCATHLYLQQAEIVAQAIPGEAERTRLFADMNLAVQLLTLVLQSLVGPLLTRRVGLAVALAATPLAYLLAFVCLGTLPTLAVFVVADVIRRGLAYGVAVPAREVLFTVVSRDDKYKSKGFIDTVILRGGDAISSQLLAALRYAIAAPNLVQWLMIPVAASWMILSVVLARWHRIETRTLSCTSEV